MTDRRYGYMWRLIFGKFARHAGPPA